MFGRQRKQPGGDGAQIPVDATLEGDIARVEQAAADYLENRTDATRRELLGALETLDDQTQQSDAYGESVIGSAALGYASKGEVLGETSLDSVVDEVPSAELTRAVRPRQGRQGRGTRADLRHPRLPAVRPGGPCDDPESGTGEALRPSGARIAGPVKRWICP